ncbi:hypothetical protein [Methanobrevibacter sp.]|uniref:hypothetical protein n=1 Tax=Methanobrevibacter sp. TaxID=66852 RepID=UPI00386B5528
MINGIKPIPLGIPPLTFGKRFPKYPLSPKNLKIIFKIKVPTIDKMKTKINAKNIDEYI